MNKKRVVANSTSANKSDVEWRLWANLPRVDYRQACELSLGISPYRSQNLEKDLEFELLMRKAIAREHMADRTLPYEFVAEELTFGLASGQAESWLVRLTEFRDWGESLVQPFSFPDEFPRSAKDSTSISKSAADHIAGYPDELRAAVEAYTALRENPLLLAGKSPKNALKLWLEQHRPDIGSNARERIATVSNWKPKGGAPATPTSKPSPPDPD